MEVIEENDRRSVAEIRDFFRHLEKGKTEVPLDGKKAATPPPPPKPKRTFEQDIYDSRKQQGMAPIKKSVSLERPKRPPPPIPPGKSSARSLSESLDYGHVYAAVEGTSQQAEEAIYSPVLLEGKPKYFQLSHEYEETLINGETTKPCHYSLRRCYSNRAIGRRSSRSDFADERLQQKEENGKLYYASSDIGCSKLNGSTRMTNLKPVPVGHSDKTTKRNSSFRFRKKAGSILSKSMDSSKAAAKQAFAAGKLMGQKIRARASTTTEEAKFLNKRWSNASAAAAEATASDSDEATSDGTAQENEESSAFRRRARLTRRRTMDLYGQQEIAFRRRKAPQLFDVAVLIRLVPAGDEHRNLVRTCSDNGLQSSPQFVPVVAVQYPNLGLVEKQRSLEEATSSSAPVNSAELLAALPSLCYPDFSSATSYGDEDVWTGQEDFVLTLTDGVGQRKFAYCCRFLNRAAGGQDVEGEGEGGGRVTPEVLAIVSPLQASAFYLRLANEAVVYARQRPPPDSDYILKNFLRSLFHMPFPEGGRLVIRANSSLSVGREAVIESRGGTAMGRQGAPALIRRLSVTTTLAVFSALLAEKRVLLVGESVSTVSRLVQMFSSLLRPFEWPHTLVPVLPDSHLDLCYAPTPFLQGILRSNLGKVDDLIVQRRSGQMGEEEELLIADVDYTVLRKVAANDAYPLPTKQLKRLNKALDYIVTFYIDNSLADAAETGVADELLNEVFVEFFVSLVGHYKCCWRRLSDGQLEFEKSRFVSMPRSKSSRRFLSWFVETGMFQVWIRSKLLVVDEVDVNKKKSLFEQRVDDFAERKGGPVQVERITNQLLSRLKIRKTSHHDLP